MKYLGIIIRSDLNWADHVKYAVRKAWKALHFITRILKNGNNNTKRFAYVTSEAYTGVWSGVLGPYGDGQVSALNRVQKRAAKFANNINELGNFGTV